MDNQDKVYDLLEKLYVEFTHRFDDMSNEMKGMKDEIKGIKDEVNGMKDAVRGIEGRLDSIEKAQQESDEKNNARYIALSNKIDEQSKNLETVEIVTASNYADIAKLKSAR